MTDLKIRFGYVFLGVFIITFSIAILGACKVIPLAEDALIGFFLALGLELCICITAVFKTPNFFSDDPESISGLKKEIQRIKAEHKNEHFSAIQAFQNRERALIEQIDELKKPKPKPALQPPSSHGH